MECQIEKSINVQMPFLFLCSLEERLEVPFNLTSIFFAFLTLKLDSKSTCAVINNATAIKICTNGF